MSPFVILAMPMKNDTKPADTRGINFASKFIKEMLVRDNIYYTAATCEVVVPSFFRCKLTIKGFKKPH